MASSADATASIVNSLMHHRQGGESESFSRSAIQSLVKKLKEKRDELDALITAITTNGATQSACVTIPKTLDGRLQVASRKGFPHVIYAKIWRWPDLHKNELKQCEICIYGFDHKDKDLVCVNPYHYNRVIGPGLDLSGLTLGLAAAAAASGGQMPHNWGAFVRPQWSNGGLPQQAAGANGNGGTPSATHHYHGQHMTGYHRAPPVPPGLPHPSANGQQLPIKTNGNNHCKTEINLESSSASPSSSDSSSGSNNRTNWYKEQQQPSSLNFVPGKNLNEESSNGSGMWNKNNGDSNRMGPSTAGGPAALVAAAAVRAAAAKSAAASAGPISSQPMPEAWCSIAYFELDAQVGETNKVPSSCHVVKVDGYFSPQSNGSNGGSDRRFCLGPLTNVHRTDASEKTRRYIGRGIELEIRGEGDVWIRCLSDYAVFVSSYYLDRQAGRSPGDTVHKIYPGAGCGEGQGRGVQVFDLRQCFDQMRMQVSAAASATAAQAAAVAGALGNGPKDSEGDTGNGSAAAGSIEIGVDDLRRLCKLRLSFVKGWGPDYKQRMKIEETPCWIEVHLHRALQLSDQVLHSIPQRNPQQRQAQQQQPQQQPTQVTHPE